MDLQKPMNSQESQPHGDSPPSSSSSSVVAWILILATLLLLVLGALLVARFSTRQSRLPGFTRKEFDEGWSQWQSVAPADYRIKTVVEGRQPAEYEVVVREGRIVKATRNGQPLTQQRTMGTWSVPGMFDTIELDLDTTEETQPRLQLTLRGEFDEQWGFPRRYLRNDYTSKTETQWTVIEFEPQGTTVLPGGVQAMPMR